MYPASVRKVNGTVMGEESFVGGANGSAVFGGVSSVTFDYGKNITGVVSITVGSSSSPNAFKCLPCTESLLWINGQVSDATTEACLDEML